MDRLGRILMVEDDPKDVELSLMALEEYNLANEVIVLGDGAEALDYLYCRGNFAGRTSESCCLAARSKAAQGGRIGVAAADQGRRETESNPGGGADLIA